MGTRAEQVLQAIVAAIAERRQEIDDDDGLRMMSLTVYFDREPPRGVREVTYRSERVYRSKR